MTVGFSTLNSTSISSLFGSAGVSTSSGSGDSTSSLLTDWASLKNGTTTKLAKAYYGNTETKSSISATAKQANEFLKKNSALNKDALSLKVVASSLADSKSLFTEKVESKDKDGKVVKDDDGNAVKDYNRDKIASTVKDFTEKYNEVVQSGGDSNNNSVLRNTMYMTRMSKANEDLLADVGITIGEDNKLSVDEEKVKTADINKLSSLFSGSGSYAASVEARASEIVNAVNYENNRLSQYNSSGNYASTDKGGQLFDGTW